MTLKLGIALGILLVIAAGIIWIYRAGGESVLTSIERQNNAAGNASDQARSDYDRCRDDGGVYDFATGQCHRTAPRRRN